jgi:type 1 fimbriae regulatory protein FimB
MRQRSPEGAPANPVKTKRGRRKPAQQLKYLTGEEIERLFAAIASVRDRAIFRVGYHRGLRAREVGLLTLANWRRSAERLYVTRLKGSISGEFGLTRIETTALKAWAKVRGDRPGALFPSRLGRPISQQMLDVLVKRYGALASIPREKCMWKSLRHSCGTAMLERGRDIAEVKDHLGHVEISNTMIYAQVTNKHRDRVATEMKEWK